MPRKTEVIRAEIEKLDAEIEALLQSEAEDADSKVIELNAKSKELDAELASAKEVEQARADLVARKASGGQAARQPSPSGDAGRSVIPARVLTARSRHFENSKDAFVAAIYLAHLQGGTQRTGEILASQSVGTDGKGGFTVPDPLSNTLINLLETRGIARQKCSRKVMTALTQTFPKLLTHAAVSYPDEAAAIGETDVTFGQVLLTAKKIAALVKMSSEISEDSAISMIDTVVESIAYAVATAEDANLFIGVTGGVNTTGIEGDASVADVNVASVAALTLANLTACTIGVGNPVVGAVNEWYMNSTVFHGPIRDLLNAAGGNTMREFEEAQRPMLLGYPVNFVNVMPGSTPSTSGDMIAAFGDVGIGCYFGDRRNWSFKVLNELYAENDQVGVIGTERIDLKVANPEVLAKVTLT